MSFVNFGIAAMTGLLLNMGSVGVSTMNQAVASDEAVESKGCATHFGKRTDLMFKYVGPDYTQAEVEKLENWEYVEDEDDANCDTRDFERACVIYIDPSEVDNPNSSNPTLKSSIQLTTGSLISGVYYINGANVPLTPVNEKHS